jgi:two-component sensor histidine kinase
MDAAAPLVSVTRRFVENALEKFIADGDLVSRVAMAAHELLENAAKYARHSSAELSITMNRDEDGRRGDVTVRMSNVTSPAHIDRLKQSFEELDACDDPLVLYIRLMRRNAQKTDVSGLGLARIKAEAEMTLGLRVEGEAVTIVARTSLPAEERS